MAPSGSSVVYCASSKAGTPGASSGVPPRVCGGACRGDVHVDVGVWPPMDAVPAVDGVVDVVDIHVRSDTDALPVALGDFEGGDIPFCTL